MTKLKLWPNSNCDNAKIIRKPKNSNFDKTFFLLLSFFVTIFVSHFCCYNFFVTFFSKNKLTHWQLRDVFRAAFHNTRNVFFVAKSSIPSPRLTCIVCQRSQKIYALLRHFKMVLSSCGTENAPSMLSSTDIWIAYQG